MSYRSEDWQYVAGILTRQYKGWGEHAFHEPSPLPAKGDVCKDVHRIRGNCPECDQIPADEAEAIIDALEIDETNEYVERLQKFSESSFETLVIIKDLAEKFAADNPNMAEDIEDLLGEITYQIEDVCPVTKPISYLGYEGVFDRKASINNILECLDGVHLNYIRRKLCWSGKESGIEIEVEANRWTLRNREKGWSIYTKSSQTIMCHYQNNAVEVGIGTLNKVFQRWVSPTENEVNMAKMLHPGLSNFFDILYDDIKNI